MSGLSVCPETRLEEDPEGCQDAAVVHWAVDVAAGSQGNTQSSLSAHQISVSGAAGVGFAASLSSMLLHMLLGQPKAIYSQHFKISARYLNTALPR